MTNARKIVMAGAGLTAAKAVDELLDEDFDGEIVILGSEDERPYERPPLSKDFLRGEADPPFVHEADFYDRDGVDLRTGATVASIDREGKSVTLADGETVGYDSLLLCTGAEPRRLDLPGADLDGIVTLRTMDDSKALGAAFKEGPRVVVVGAGWIGSEVAASARQMGCEVTMIAPESVPLERVLGAELGGFYKDVHTGEGVTFLGETAITGFGGGDRVQSVLTDKHGDIPADLVVVGVGVTPRTGLAEGAGLAVDNGILVDAALRTDDPSIFAAGDVANAWNPFYERRIRVEHWANARRQGAAAARSMLGREVSFDEIPYFFSDQYDVGMEYVGYATDWDRIVYRGDVAKREFIAFWIKDGRIAAGMNVNVWDVSETIRDLIGARVEVDLDRLADPEVELSSLMPG